jgi:O-antigen/teichoic acid export membrane protein
MSGIEYGTMLTVMGIINAVGSSLGNPLNNTRILLDSEYGRKNLSGDFNLIFLICLPITVLVVLIFSGLIYSSININTICYAVISALVLFRSYYSAGYRIIINYKKVLYSNIWGVVGYIIGLFITFYTNEWFFTFLFGELTACIYIFFTSQILQDKYKKTYLFKKSFLKYSLIMSATVISMAITYMDRFIIYPLLGAEQVSIYNVASFMGKMAAIVMGPISAVLLTYYAKEVQLSVKQFYIRTGFFTLASAILFLLILLVGMPITRVLYPTLAEDASRYFIIANLASTVLILGNTIMPTLLKFCSSKWQPVIQVIFVILYLIFGYFGMIRNELMGFCYAILFVNIIRIAVMLAIATFTLYGQEDKTISGSVNS